MRGYRNEDFYSYQRTQKIEQERAAKELERKRREARFSLIMFTLLTGMGALIVMSGFFFASLGGGWFAFALVAWIAGGAYVVGFGGFLIGSIMDWRKVR